MMKNENNSVSKKAENEPTLPTLTPYEKIRSMVIEKNARKFSELGLLKIADQYREQNAISTKRKELSSDVLHGDDQDYVPEDDHNSDDDISHKLEEEEIKLPSKTKPKAKKGKTREQPSRKSKKQPSKEPLCPSLEMEEFLTIQEGMDPSKASDIQNEVQRLEQEQSRFKRQHSTIVSLENQGEEDLPSQNGPKRKGRGPTNMFEVHARSVTDRVAIYCNHKGQPIGPPEKVKELSRFIGTIAHDSNWTPLTYTNWKKVPNKEKMWDYANSKYILPPESSHWFYETIAASWRGFKSRLKERHYFRYNSYAERLKDPPKRVPLAHFKILLKYWDTDVSKKISFQNAKNRQEQDSMHTVGPVSFAIRYEQLVQEKGVQPTKRELFEETRARQEGRTYKRPDDDTRKKIQAMRDLELTRASCTEDDNDINACNHYKDPFDEVMGDNRCGRLRLEGRGICRKKLNDKDTGTSLILPKEVMDSIKAAVTEDVQRDIIAEKEALAKEKEMHAAQIAEMQRLSSELDSRASILEEKQKDLEGQKGTLTLDAVAKAIVELRKKDPSLTPELIAQVIVSSATLDT